MDDQNKTFRTRLVSFWVLTNAALAIAILQANGLNTTADEEQAKTTTYFNIILWTTAGLSLVRFIGCVWLVNSQSLSVALFAHFEFLAT